MAEVGRSTSPVLAGGRDFARLGRPCGDVALYVPDDWSAADGPVEMPSVA